jgi:hypothetical protein
MGNALHRLRGHVGATLTIVTAHDPLQVSPCSGEISASPFTDRFGVYIIIIALPVKGTRPVNGSLTTFVASLKPRLM